MHRNRKGRALRVAAAGIAFVSSVQCRPKEDHPVGSLVAAPPVDDAAAVIEAGAGPPAASTVVDAGVVTKADASATACDAVQEHFRLTEPLHGVNGVLSLLACRTDDEPVWNKSRPEQLAILRVVSDSGRELDRRLLRSASAKLESAVLRSDGRPTFLVTEDLTAGFGTHSGPVTTLYDVTEARLDEVTDASGKALSFASTMWATWHHVPHGKGQDILSAVIRTDLLPDGGVSRESVLTRWVFAGGGWTAVTKKEPGAVELVDGADLPHYPPVR